MKEPFRKAFTENGMGKKGQVTIFIIAGVVVLFAAFFIGYLQNEDFRQRVESELFGAGVVPEQAKGVVSYLDNCIEDLAVEGLVLMGNQGGYVDIPLAVNANPRTYLGFAGLRIPYWLYGESNVNIPSRARMEEELGNYIERNFVTGCNLAEFRNQGYVFDIGEVESRVDIGDEEVRVRLESGFGVAIKGEVFELKDYVSVSLGVPLGKLWEVGSDIVARELRGGPLEFNTLNLISAYSKEREFMPPIAGFEFKCGERSWRMSEVKENFKNVVSSYVPSLRVEGSKNENDFVDEFYKSMIINRVTGKNIRDVDVSFSYFKDWPLFLDIFPREGERLRAGGLSLNAPFFGVFCTNFYNFRYTALYPLLVTLEEDDYSFSFPVEVYVKDNYGRRNLFGDENLEFEDLNPTRSLFCDEDQRLSGEVDLLIVDGLTGEELDVDVNYICGLNSCVVGNSADGFREKFPLCKGGELAIEEEGYARYKERLDTGVDGISKVIELEPFRDRVVSVKVFEVDGEGVVVSERDLNEKEEVFLEMSKVNSDLLGYDYQVAFTFAKGDEGKGIEIVPGDYAINAQLQLDKKIALGREEVEGNLFTGGELDGATIGGAKVEDYYLDKEVLDANEEIEFFVVSFGEPEKLSDLDKAFDLSGFDLEPRLK